MGNIIGFDTEYATKKKITREKMSLIDLVEEIKTEGKKCITDQDIEGMARRVLEDAGCSDIDGAIPIVSIANSLNFRTIAVSGIPESISGNIFIGGKTKDVYGNDKVIVVSKDEEPFKQRFIIAHELGHYFIDYLSDKALQNLDELYVVAYSKGQSTHNEAEKRIDKFAAELLMPSDKFQKQYNIAAEFSDNNYMYIISYLSKVFKTERKSIELRISEVIR